MVVLLEGELGIGKTSLAEEFLHELAAEQAIIARGRFHESLRR